MVMIVLAAMVAMALACICEREPNCTAGICFHGSCDCHLHAGENVVGSICYGHTCTMYLYNTCTCTCTRMSAVTCVAYTHPEYILWNPKYAKRNVSSVSLEILLLSGCHGICMVPLYKQHHACV